MTSSVIDSIWQLSYGSLFISAIGYDHHSYFLRKIQSYSTHNYFILFSISFYQIWYGCSVDTKVKIHIHTRKRTKQLKRSALIHTWIKHVFTGENCIPMVICKLLKIKNSLWLLTNDNERIRIIIGSV